MGFIGTDKSGEDAECWFPCAPTATEEMQEDKTTTHDITFSSEGIASCGVSGE
jgi:hypothetical protein